MIVLTFRAPAPPLNANDREHWAPRSIRTKAWRAAAATAAIAHGVSRDQPRSAVQLVLPVHSLKVRRDPSNWAPTTKAVVDGLVDAGLWRDDSGEYVATVEPRFERGGDVRIEITPFEGAS